MTPTKPSFTFRVKHKNVICDFRQVNIKADNRHMAEQFLRENYFEIAN